MSSEWATHCGVIASEETDKEGEQIFTNLCEISLHVLDRTSKVS
jgi:hypothetical protein